MSQQPDLREAERGWAGQRQAVVRGVPLLLPAHLPRHHRLPLRRHHSSHHHQHRARVRPLPPHPHVQLDIPTNDIINWITIKTIFHYKISVHKSHT